MTYRQNLLLVFFVEDFNAIFDSTNVIEHIKKGSTACSDLTRTMLYKVLGMCSNMVKINKKTKK